MIVLDSSAAVDYLAGYEPRATWVAERLLADPDLHAPHVLDLEVIGAVRRAALKGELSRVRARQVISDLIDLDITRYPHLPFIERIWAVRDNLTASDAAFVTLAEALGATLVTTDSALAAAPGIAARVESVPRSIS